MGISLWLIHLAAGLGTVPV